MVAWDNFNHHNRHSRIYCQVHIRSLFIPALKSSATANPFHGDDNKNRPRSGCCGGDFSL